MRAYIILMHHWFPCMCGLPAESALWRALEWKKATHVFLPDRPYAMTDTNDTHKWKESMQLTKTNCIVYVWLSESSRYTLTMDFLVHKSLFCCLSLSIVYLERILAQYYLPIRHWFRTNRITELGAQSICYLRKWDFAIGLNRRITVELNLWNI